MLKKEEEVVFFENQEGEFPPPPVFFCCQKALCVRRLFSFYNETMFASRFGRE